MKAHVVKDHVAKACARGAALALACATAVATGSAALADTSIATKWRPIGEAQGDCMAHAQMAIFRAGFDASEPGSQTMSGKRGDYTASIRCLSEQRIVFFVMSGPQPTVTARYLEVLWGHF